MREIVTKEQHKQDRKVKSVRRKGVGLGRFYSDEVIKTQLRGERTQKDF